MDVKPTNNDPYNTCKLFHDTIFCGEIVAGASLINTMVGRRSRRRKSGTQAKVSVVLSEAEVSMFVAGQSKICRLYGVSCARTVCQWKTGESWTISFHYILKERVGRDPVGIQVIHHDHNIHFRLIAHRKHLFSLNHVYWWFWDASTKHE